MEDLPARGLAVRTETRGAKLPVAALDSRVHQQAVPVGRYSRWALLLDFVYCDRGFDGDSETACLWRGLLEVLESSILAILTAVARGAPSSARPLLFVGDI